VIPVSVLHKTRGPQCPIIAVVLLYSTLAVLPYFIPGAAVLKSEEFEFSLIPAILFAKQVIAGKSIYWSHAIGLGSPWPIPVGITHSPMTLLLPSMAPMTATGCIALVHLAAAGISFGALALRMGLSTPITIVSVLSVVGSSALEFLFVSDATSAFLTWTALPVALLCMQILLTSSDRTGVIVASIALGLTLGYAVLNAHVGLLSSYCVGLALFVLGTGRRAAARLPYLILAAVIGMCVGAEKLVLLAAETMRFPADVTRFQAGLPGGIRGALWGAFIRPFFAPAPEHLVNLKQFFSGYINANMTVRTVGFGAVFGVVALFCSFRLVWTDWRWRPFGVMFAGGITLLLIPPSWLPKAVSGVFPIRDVVTIAGVLLAAGCFQRWLESGLSRRWVNGALVVQATLVVFNAFPLVAGSEFVVSRGIFSVRTYNDLINLDIPTPYIRALNEAVGPGTQTPRRFVVSAHSSWLLDRETMVDQGAVANISIAHGFSEVSFIAKGISFDTIRRSQSVPYGSILGDRISNWEWNDYNGDWTYDNDALLSLMGIRAVVTAGGEPVTASGLQKVITLKGRDGYSLDVYSYRNALPLAFFVPPNAADAPLPFRSGCDNESLICHDVSSIVAVARSDGMVAETGDNRITLSFPAAQGEQTVLVSSMYRPGWHAFGSNGQIIPVREWHGLLRLDVPPDETKIEARYQPKLVMIGRALAIGSLIVCLLILTGLAWRMPPRNATIKT
jgi:hypothetical protein